MQVEIQQRQRRLVSLQDAPIRLSSTGSYRKRILRASIQDVVDFLVPDLLIALADVQPDETDEFLHLPGAAASFK